MIDILLVGITGAMGKTILESLPDDMNVVSGVGQGTLPNSNVPVYTDFNAVKESFDVIVDFSHVSLLNEVLKFAQHHKKPLLIASTGLMDSDHEKIDEASKYIPIIQSGNYSFGVYALNQAVSLLAEILQDSDIEIVEKHHRYKQDAPSGTAQMLVDQVLNKRGNMNLIYGREGQTGLRQPNDLAVHALRGGTIVGEHSVLFAMEDELIEIKHQAASKKIFAQGAFKAIRFILKQTKGRYGLEDVVHD